MYYKNKTIEKISKNELVDQRIKCETVFKELFPIINPELLRLARASPNIEEMFFYNAYPDKTIINELMMIRINSLMNANFDEEIEAERLCEKFQILVKRYGSGVMARIFLSDEKKRHSITFEMQNSENRISATVAFSSVLALKKCLKAGVVYPYEIININQCMELVAKSGGVFKEDK